MSNYIRWKALKEKGVKLAEVPAFEFYETDEDTVIAQFEQLPKNFFPDRILDPCMGTGVYGWVARQFYRGSKINGVDIRSVDTCEFLNAQYQTDFLKMDDAPHYDLIISNPPYSYNEQFVRHSMRMLRPGGWLSFLLRASWAESEGRYALFTEELPPRYIVTLSKRPSFVPSGDGDPHHYAYFMWQKNWKGETVHRWSHSNKEKVALLTAQRKLFL
jgi:SAM-dependent methyltransferase